MTGEHRLDFARAVAGELADDLADALDAAEVDAA